MDITELVYHILKNYAPDELAETLIAEFTGRMDMRTSELVGALRRLQLEAIHYRDSKRGEYFLTLAIENAEHTIMHVTQEMV